MDSLAHISFSGVEAVAGRGRVSRLGSRPGAAGREYARVDDEEPVPPLMAWMLDRAGLAHCAYRSSAMRRRVAACLRRLRVNTPEAARALLEQRPELLPAALNTALIGVSRFFRDEAVFECLEQRVLPELFSERALVRVCSAGSSAGQELYSVAMLVAEAGMLGRCSLLGLDCRADAVREAERGVYGHADVVGMPAARRARFFREERDGVEILPALRRHVEWRVEDLLAPRDDERWDLVLFRNVSIYLTEAFGREVWENLCARLNPGGYLVTGKAERPPPGLPLIRVAQAVYRKARV